MAEVPVPVEVVFCYVEEYPDMRVKEPRRLEMEARYLEYAVVCAPAILDVLYRRRADVASDKDLEARVLQYLPQKGRCRCLAVCPGDSQHRGVHEPPRELDLAYDLCAIGARLDQKRQLVGHAGAYDDQVNTLDCYPGMAARPYLDARERVYSGDRLSLLRVCRHDTGPAFGEEAGHRDAGRAAADYHGALAGQSGPRCRKALALF